MRARSLFLALFLALLGSSCVRLRWQRVRLETPPDTAAIQSFVPGATSLDEALAALGAPLQVFEHDVDGVAVTYGHFDSRQYGVQVSAPVKQVNLGVNYGNGAGDLDGVVLFFDSSYVLREVREGKLGDIISAPLKRRPSYNE